MIQKIILLDDYRDRCSVYSVLCMRSYTYYNRLKIMFQLPIILLSSILSILNGNMGNVNKDAMNIVNISINALTAILLVVQNNLKFESRAMHFKQVSVSFTKLEREVEKYLITNQEDKDIADDFVKSCMTSYDTICENLQFDVPSSICASVRARYAGKKTLPLLINGIKKEAQYRKSSICDVVFTNEADNNKKMLLVYRMKYKIEKSQIKDKKYTATFYDETGTKIRTTHFGAVGYEDYTTHRDDDRKKLYLDRHQKNEDWNDYMSAGSLSRYILWNKPTIYSSIADYAKRFGLKRV